MAQPDKEGMPFDPISSMLEAGAAIMELIDTFQKAGMKRMEAVYFTAVYVANLHNQGGSDGQQDHLG